ncbi:hypothetical protein A3L04_06935 [Thermococcus chitonophagus]|uniref:DUF4405 domain-containing protein n=1 Tax=Thermococcus chitonophagus TaxID=54262 RepID=A0A160VWH2_9EURY|nr:hypothetical protein [Thermococcus chitonophagus]ASJ16828.1 hypothetical protein A3L04_06935 [Thermococcus chitonophagus]CUX78301.1 hypothetical protein CHITON_1522 [Thermococcus chitonophagus]
MNLMKKAFEEAMGNPKMRRKLKVKAVLSLILVVGFLGVVFITVGTIIATKTGSFMGMTRLDFLQLRARYGLFMMVLIFLHILMNREILKLEAKLLFS